MQKTVRWILALLAPVVAAILAIPGCRIQVCTGDHCGGGSDVGGWGGDGGDAWQDTGGGSGGGGGAGGVTVSLAELDPMEMARGRARAGYAAYMMSGLVGEKIAAVPDPSTLDSVTVKQFVDEAAPIAWAAAGEWVNGIELQSPPSLTPNYECAKPPMSCVEQYHKCEFAYVCIVVDCGESKCSSCPDLWPLPQLAFDRWCVYTCIVDDPPVISGWAIRFHVTILDEWWTYCFGNN